MVGLAGALGWWDSVGTEGGGIGWGPGVVGLAAAHGCSRGVGLAGALGWWDWQAP